MTRPGGLALIVISLSLVPPASMAGEAQGSSPYASADACSACHETIHSYWLESSHAVSASRPSYLDALKALGESDAGRSARRDCVRCHAPMALATDDFEMADAVTREGVSCDFCHTVAAVDLSQPRHPFQLAPGPVKLGPFAYTESPFHGTGYSTLHRSSALLCAACHEYSNSSGVPVLSTYSEWWEGPYAAKGEICQECHMPLVPGDSVREGMEPSHRRINLHRMAGGRVASKLKSGLRLELASAAIGSSTARVEVVVTNAGAGHAVPGGLPNKALVVSVGVEGPSGKLMHRRERLYRRVLVDASGAPLTAVADMFLRAASVGEDSRLAPKESRAETFTVPLPDGWRAIVARLEYRETLDPGDDPKTTLVAERRRDR